MKKYTWLLLLLVLLMGISVFAQGYYTFCDRNGVTLYVQITSNGVYTSFIPAQGWLFYSLKNYDSKGYYYVYQKWCVAISSNGQTLLMGLANNMSAANTFYAYNANSSWNSGSSTNSTTNKPELCYTCHGTGRCEVCRLYGSSSTCTGCGGTGLCWHCHGSGRQ
jgi:hypothetical protein